MRQNVGLAPKFVWSKVVGQKVCFPFWIPTNCLSWRCRWMESQIVESHPHYDWRFWYGLFCNSYPHHPIWSITLFNVSSSILRFLLNDQEPSTRPGFLPMRLVKNKRFAHLNGETSVILLQRRDILHGIEAYLFTHPLVELFFADTYLILKKSI